MGQSLVKNYIHLVFSTKNRQPFIKPYIEQELHTYLGGVCKQLNCPVLTVGGHVDHVHLLFMLSKKVPLMDVVKKIKASSSKWIKTKGVELNKFYWQDGYGAFSINPREINTVIEYINNQHEHHRTRTFQDEYRAFLKQYEVAFDERYVWE